MASHPLTPHPHRASVAARPHHRRALRRDQQWTSRQPAALLPPERNAAVGLVYGLPLSLALWAGIAAAIHFI